MLLTPEQRTRRAGQPLGVGLALALLDQGWILHSTPGVFHLQSQSASLNPFAAVIDQLMSGKLSAQDWKTQTDELGISRLRLAPNTI